MRKDARCENADDDQKRDPEQVRMALGEGARVRTTLISRVELLRA